jgi:hypothetical protein
VAIAIILALLLKETGTAVRLISARPNQEAYK